MQNNITGSIREYRPGTKRVLVKYAGGDRKPEEVFIGPGTSSLELLQSLNLRPEEFSISKGSPDTMLGSDEILYPSVEDGDLLYVTSRVDAG